MRFWWTAGGLDMAATLMGHHPHLTAWPSASVPNKYGVVLPDR